MGARPVVTVVTKEPAYVVAWNALLSDPATAAACAEGLSRGQRESGAMWGERPLCVSLRPNLITRRQYRANTTASEALYGALSRLESALLRDDELRRELDLSPEEDRLALADPGFTAASPSSRLDGFVSDGVIHYVEYNAESPAGMAYNDVLVRIFERLPAMRAFRKRYRARPVRAASKQLTAMSRAHGRKVGTIAIVDWTGLPTLTEFQMFQRAFTDSGVKTLICAPEDLTYRGGRLRAKGMPIDVVYRRVLLSELLAKPDVARPLLQAYLAGDVTVVNSLRAKLLHKKMSLALLSDDRYARLYTPSQRRAIAKHVPWTRKVREGHTTYGEKVIDLTDFIIRNRERLVLKPNDEYGGKGVVLGWTVDRHEWEQVLLTALTTSFVVQEKVAVPREPFPVLLDRVHFLDLSVDCDPYLFWGRVGGVLTRLSSSALLNVTAGAGSVVPTYVVDGAA
ncbi:MAG TPA: circularly permuted type 2 ATP-grasp protein [Candidatus Limnocylindria bacterium]|nr:circularly permuted type 2 ATP-grasp protein [Candidatus Limnocylindria bacterium]